MSGPLRVVLAEDNYLVREVTRQLLDATGEVVIVDALVGRRARQRSSPLAHLTARELDVLGAMAQGKTNAAIAESLSLSVSAVEKHSNAIFAKLGLGEEPQVHRRVAAVLTFLRDTGGHAEDAPGT